jgi:hypothetical protein
LGRLASSRGTGPRPAARGRWPVVSDTGLWDAEGISFRPPLGSCADLCLMFSVWRLRWSGDLVGLGPQRANRCATPPAWQRGPGQVPGASVLVLPQAPARTVDSTVRRCPSRLEASVLFCSVLVAVEPKLLPVRFAIVIPFARGRSLLFVTKRRTEPVRNPAQSGWRATYGNSMYLRICK